MKKVMAIILSLAMTMALTVGLASCGNDTLTGTINVGALNGPTGMGMVNLMDRPEEYNIEVFQSPTDAVAKLLNGDVDIAAVPSNMAAVLYNKTKGNVVAVSPITLGVLYIMDNGSGVTSFKDLKGKTIVSSGQGGAPEYILQRVLESQGLKLYEDVDVKWLANHSDVAKTLMTTKGTVAMMPEPFVSSVSSQSKGKINIAFDLNQLWQETTGKELPMGVLVTTKKFIEEREGDLAIFLKDYKESVDFVNDNPTVAAKTIVAQGFLPSEEIAEAAIPNCNIVVYIDGDKEEGMEMLKMFNEELFKMAPASVGGALPDEDLYY